jgi:CubicO group peptidase (beta-lactamase class C family)
MPLQANVRQDLRHRALLVASWLFLVFAQCSLPASEEFPAAKWRMGTPESQGLDSDVLVEALNYVHANHIPLHSFLIVRNGVVVLEAYFYPYSGREVHDVASVTKSFTLRRRLALPSKKG